eukprot:comp23907_c0_seq1/m.42094 comp23907_c0_seq1/g.42094  ORF comp23907_c0_seq1/g.42094 comp23907_c0_seq1/m.42094 type:complete len:242 (-) comp23907_c0_seq1:71-796(-)
MSNPDELLHLFQSMGTTDHETLVQQMMAVVSSNDPQACLFFLEANNWNLQAAIASFYESGSNEIYEQLQHPPEVTLVGDMTLDNKDALAPNAPFRQTWKIRNTGHEQWPYSTCVLWVSGEKFPESPRAVKVPPLFPGQETDITIPMRCPSKPGSYASAWRLCCDEGFQMFFGEQMWIVTNVVDPTNVVLDDVEQQRLRLEQEHALDALTEGFSRSSFSAQGGHMNFGTYAGRHGGDGNMDL